MYTSSVLKLNKNCIVFPIVFQGEDVNPIGVLKVVANFIKFLIKVKRKSFMFCYLPFKNLLKN